MKKTVLIYGLIAGTLISTFMAISMLRASSDISCLADSSSMIVGFLAMFIAFAFIFVAVKQYRDKQNGGTISFGKAFRIGLFIALIASTMYVITWGALYNYAFPDFMEHYTEFMMKDAKASLSGIELDKKVAELNEYKEMYKSPIGFTLMTYVEILPVGLLVSLIAALVLWKRKPIEVTVVDQR